LSIVTPLRARLSHEEPEAGNLHVWRTFVLRATADMIAWGDMRGRPRDHDPQLDQVGPPFHRRVDQGTDLYHRIDRIYSLVHMLCSLMEQNPNGECREPMTPLVLG
jgi:hypothetical protein